jgi:hypothetical protein
MRISDLQRRIIARVLDPDAEAYITAVEFADGQPLEQDIKNAIDDFVVGCKSDGIWDAIKASCILAGARTLNGLLVPLKGAAPTNVNFVSADYNRKTGLKGNGSSKYLDTGRGNQTDPQNNFSAAIYRTQIGNKSALEFYLGAGGNVAGATGIFSNSGTTSITFRNRAQAGDVISSVRNTLGFIGMSRSSGANYSTRVSESVEQFNRQSQTPVSATFHIFGADAWGLSRSDDRFSFYSLGESLDLGLLNARLTTLMNTYNTIL